jgi:hypothetical protein
MDYGQTNWRSASAMYNLYSITTSQAATRRLANLLSSAQACLTRDGPSVFEHV